MHDQTLAGPDSSRGRAAAGALEQPRSTHVAAPHGESLRTLLTRRTAGGVLLRHLLGAMRRAAALHRHGMVHGHIRPENIVLAPRADDGEAVPMLLGRGDAHGGQPAAHAYQAPEQRAGWVLDPRTDVYGFGVVLHEVLTGRLPADLHTAPPAGMPARALLSLGADSDHVPAGLARLVRAALSPDPALRPNSMAALMAAIEPYTRHPALRAPLPPRPRLRARPPARARRPMRARIGVAFAALALAGALGTAAAQPELAAQVRSGLVAASAMLPGFGLADVK